jgi:hypothetical protein
MRCGPALIKREVNICVGRIRHKYHITLLLQLLLDQISDEIKLFLRCHICLFRHLLEIPLTQHVTSVFVCPLFPL